MFNSRSLRSSRAYIDQIVRVGVTVSLTMSAAHRKKAPLFCKRGDFSPGSPVEKYNQASGYLPGLA